MDPNGIAIEVPKFPSLMVLVPENVRENHGNTMGTPWETELKTRVASLLSKSIT